MNAATKPTKPKIIPYSIYSLFGVPTTTSGRFVDVGTVLLVVGKEDEDKEGEEGGDLEDDGGVEKEGEEGEENEEEVEEDEEGTEDHGEGVEGGAGGAEEVIMVVVAVVVTIAVVVVVESGRRVVLATGDVVAVVVVVVVVERCPRAVVVVVVVVVSRCRRFSNPQVRNTICRSSQSSTYSSCPGSIGTRKCWWLTRNVSTGYSTQRSIHHTIAFVMPQTCTHSLTSCS